MVYRFLCHIAINLVNESKANLSLMHVFHAPCINPNPHAAPPAASHVRGAALARDVPVGH